MIQGFRLFQYKKWCIPIIILMLFQVNGQAHSRIKKIGKATIVSDSLPKRIRESSGLIFYKEKLWTIDDSGDGPYIFVMDSTGHKLLQTIEVTNAINVDWEEITQDESNIYIGDFGNDFGLRDSLSIYKIEKSKISDAANSKVKAEIIRFTYQNKPKINKRKLQRSDYDCEAMVCVNDTLVLFSKSWQDYLCRVYLVPSKPGNYEVKPYDTLFIKGLVTGATLSDDNSKLLLVGYRHYIPFVYAINHFSIDNISTLKSVRRTYPRYTGYQTEGITFISENELVISSEYNKVRKGVLLRLKVK